MTFDEKKEPTYEELVEKVKECEIQEKVYLSIIEQLENTYSSMAVDQTEIEKKNAQMLDERLRLDAILENMADSLILVNHQKKITHVNRPFLKIFNKTSAEVINQYIADALKDTEALTAIEDILGNPADGMTRNVSLNDGSYIKITVSTITIDNYLEGFVCSFRDVTHDVEVDKMKTEFISTVSHELRTPMTSILGFSENTQEFFENDIIPVLPVDNKRVQRRSKSIMRNLSIVVSEGDRLTRLINDVLDIAKMESGNIEWDIQAVDIIAVCNQALSAVAGYPKSDQVEIVFNAPDKAPVVTGDPDRLVQVIANLMSNALKFTEQGCVTLSAEPRDKDVKVTVKDTGHGIKDENLNKVFEKFKQVGDDLEKDKPKGTGLGLPICKEIVKHLGGDIWAESEFGKGTSFCFTVAYHATATEKTGSQWPHLTKMVANEVKQKALNNAKDRSVNVLIADDDPNIRELLRQELYSEEYHVLEACDGKEALKLVKDSRNNIDLILLDIMMPDIDGYDVLSVIKTNEQLAHIPIIIVSAYEVKGKTYKLGADGFISKPIDKSKLLSKISELLTGSIEKNVLVIDSDDDITSDIVVSLKEKGYVVNTAGNGEDGFKKAQIENPDVIMLNMEAPDIKKGMETLKKLRLDESTAHIHIILLADEMNKDARRIAETLKVEISKHDEVPKIL